MSYENRLMQMKKMLKKAPAEKVKETPFKKPPVPEYAERWEAAGLVRIDNQFAGPQWLVDDIWVHYEIPYSDHFPSTVTYRLALK